MGLFCAEVTPGTKRVLLEWAAKKLGVERLPSETQAIGIIYTGPEVSEIRAVVMFNAFYGIQASIHIVSDGRKRWLTKDILRQIFTYAYDVIGVKRLTGYTPASMDRAISLALKIGFKIEGVQRRAHTNGEDLVMTGMMRDECVWLDDIEGVENGQQGRAGI